MNTNPVQSPAEFIAAKAITPYAAEALGKVLAPYSSLEPDAYIGIAESLYAAYLIGGNEALMGLDIKRTL